MNRFDGLLAFFGLLLLAAFAILPVVAFVMVARAQRRIAELERRQFELSTWVGMHEGALRQLWGAVQPRSEPPPSPAPGPPTVAAGPAPRESPPAAVEPPAAPLPPVTEPMPPPADAPSPGRRIDWESLIGVRLFAWVGGGALFLGAALFLQYSIQHELISPWMRVAIGLVGGAAALVFGDWVRARANLSGQALSGAGAATLYASLFAARSLYDLIPAAGAFAGMVLVTVVAGLTAVRRDTPLLALIALLGGFATPYLLSTGEDRPLALLLYVALLDVGVVVVASRKWPAFALVGLAGSTLVVLGWSAHFLDRDKLPYALFGIALLGAVFAVPMGSTARARARVTVWAAALAAVAPVVFALFATGALGDAVSPAVLTADLVLLCLGAVVTARRTRAELLAPVAAGLASATLVARAAGDLFPDERLATLLLFSAVPATFVGAWWVVRRVGEDGGLRAAVAVSAVGMYLLLTRIVALEPQNEPIAELCVYALAAAGGLLAVAVLTPAGGWMAGAHAIAFASLLVLATRYDQSRLVEFAVPIAASMLFFAFAPFFGPAWRSGRAAWLSAAAAPVAHYALFYVLSEPALGNEALGAVAIGCALLALLLLKGAQRLAFEHAADLRRALVLFGVVTLLFSTASVPILLSNEWLTVAWALEAAALVWLHLHIAHRGLLVASAVLAGATVVRLVLNPTVWEYHARSGSPVFNWYLYTFLVPAIALLVGARWLGEVRDERWAPRLARAYRGAAAVVVFVLINVEIADFFSEGEAIAFRFSEGGLAQDMAYSLAWGVYALVLLGIGIARGSKATRVGAVVVITLAMAKVFLHDLWSLGSLYRVGSIVGLAVALLAVSFLIQRFLLKERESP